MKNTLTDQASVVIDASPEQVWEAITRPEIIKKWLFDVDTETNWQEGSALVHWGIWHGKPYRDKGVILKIDPPELLSHTHWSELSGLPDLPENYQTVTYRLSRNMEGTELSITEDNLRSEEQILQSRMAWKMALGTLKSLLEA